MDPEPTKAHFPKLLRMQQTNLFNGMWNIQTEFQSEIPSFGMASVWDIIGQVWVENSLSLSEIHLDIEDMEYFSSKLQT